MSIEIDVLNGGESWPMAKPLFNAVWPPEVVEKLPWASIVFAHAELRVLVQAEPEGVVCHVGIYRREVKWNGRKMRAGGIGGVLTRENARRRGYASIALNAAIQTLKDEGSTDFALLFCRPASIPCRRKAGFSTQTATRCGSAMACKRNFHDRSGIMAKNVVVFSDGTGQDGGVRPEQRISNIYKLYWASRNHPGNAVEPHEQVAFYDAGLGTDIGATAITAPVRFVQKLLGSVAGEGIKRNIEECYEFIVNPDWIGRPSR
jgi:aminoglycoside 2'-N-acetyltransferase I